MSSNFFINYINQANKSLNLDVSFLIEAIKHIPDDTSIDQGLDHLASIASNYISINPKYDYLAAAIIMQKINKNTSDDYKVVVKELYDNRLVIKSYYDTAMRNINEINEILKTKYDERLTYFGIKTLEMTYLLKTKKKLIERPSYLYLRVALHIHSDNLDKVKQTYSLLVKGLYTHATPTMLNAGTNVGQLASCFLLGTDDSLHALYKTVYKLAMISKNSGGCAIHLSNIRGRGSLINGSGNSSGIIPYIMVLNYSFRYVDQGGKRRGACAIYLEMHHPDIMDFLDLRLNTGDIHRRAKDIFTALWVCDLFMEKVKNNEDWYLLCPSQCPGLTDVYGDEYNKLYEKYVKEGKYVDKIKARTIWRKILHSQGETGTPFIVYKDSVNRKSNQKNIGTIKSSNLCTEIVEYSDNNEYAVCNLGSISLPEYVIDRYTFDFDKLYKDTLIYTENLDKIIDINKYPSNVDETKLSNFKNRPIGLGVQGLYDVFMKMKLIYGSQKALELDSQIFETIYFAALTKSCELAKIHGPYENFKGSPASEGKLQYHLWGLTEKNLSGRWDWIGLIENIKKYGLRNSLLTTCMPTATTSQILGNTESTEPQSTNIYVRGTQSGSFTIINRYLIADLDKLKLWNEKMKNKIIYYNGSIQHIDEIPQYLKNIYRTVWEIDPKRVIDHAAARGPFLDQTQSMNLYLSPLSEEKLTWMHFYGWSKGLKTGMYYLRSRPAIDPIKFNLDAQEIKEFKKEEKVEKVCIKRKKGESTVGCEMCSS